jgi:uncharacterized protein (DUF58 family)
MQQPVSSAMNEAIEISVPQLVRLSRHAPILKLQSGQILARHAGDYQSPFKGKGMEFDESRLYQPGDDIRNIDWHVTARTNKTHTKLFREERERPVFVWVDLRSPMFFATRGCFKAVIAAQLSSLVAWGANHHGDRTGGIIFSDNVHHEFKPMRGKTGVLRLINQLVKHPAWQAQERNNQDDRAGGKALARLQRIARPGSLIYLLSDFRQLDDNAMSQINRLGRHNDLVMIYIYDQLEMRLPDAGHYRISNGRDELLIDTHDKQLVACHRSRFAEHTRRLEQVAGKNRIKLLTCTTEDNPVTVLSGAYKAHPQHD